jgi:integrase
MASVTKTANGYRVQVYVKGQRDSQTFAKKADATAWGVAREGELRAVGSGKGGTVYTLAQAMQKYADEVSIKRRGERWETVRLASFQKDEHRLPIKKRLSDVNKADMIAWRNHRLATKTHGTVLREMTLLSAVFEQARTEWEWISSNPLADVKKPTKPDHRKRVISPAETRRVLRALGHSRRATPKTVSQAVANAFLLALATGMRAGEVSSLRWADVHSFHGTAHNVKAIQLGVSRDVPLTAVARKIIARMDGWDADLVFGVDASTLSTLFRRGRQRAGLDGFTFHDARHTAATRLARKLHILDLCKMFGWKKMDQALTYYNPSAADIAKRLE